LRQRTPSGSQIAAIGDEAFNPAIAVLYERYLVPLIFAPYAQDIVARLASRPMTRVLEVAAGTGVVTRQLALKLPSSVAIIATDLNLPMARDPSRLDEATDAATAAIARRFGAGPVDGRIQAHVVAIKR